MAPGFPSREEVRDLYAERSGRDLSEIDYYVALGLWKLAIMLEGVFARYAAGQYGKADADDGIQQFARRSSGWPRPPIEAERRLG